MAIIPMRYKRITTALDDDARARLQGRIYEGASSAPARLCQSSGSDYSATSSATELSDLIDSFFDGDDDGNGGEACGETESKDVSNLDDNETESFHGYGYGYGCGTEDEMKEMLIDLIGGGADEEDDRERRLIRYEVESVCRNFDNSSSEGFKRRLMTVLRQRGIDSGLCKSRWEKTGRQPAGEYEYIDVLISGNRYIVEASFRSEFTIARPTETYKSLLEIIPKIAVIKPNELKKLLRLMSGAMRASLKTSGMMISPWRKNGYMQAKWLGSYKRTVNALPSRSAEAAVYGGGEFDGERLLGFEYSPAAAAVAVVGGESYCRKEVGRVHVVGNLKALMLSGMS